MPTVADSKNALTRKIGPLPAWAWFGIGGGALYLYRQHQAQTQAGANPNAPSSAPSDVNPDTGLPWNIDPNTGEPYGDTGTVSSGGGPTNPPPPGGGESGGPAPKKKKHKPPRKRKKVRIPRIGKVRRKGHGSNKAHPPHRTPKPKHRGPMIPSRKKNRDRGADGIKHSGTHPTHAARGRTHTARAAAVGSRPPAVASSSSSSRSSSVALEQGGRAHAGAANATPAARPRTMTPASEGSNRRQRTLTSAAQKAPAVPRHAAGHPIAKKAPASQKSTRRKK